MLVQVTELVSHPVHSHAFTYPVRHADTSPLSVLPSQRFRQLLALLHLSLQLASLRSTWQNAKLFSTTSETRATNHGSTACHSARDVLAVRPSALAIKCRARVGFAFLARRGFYYTWAGRQTGGSAPRRFSWQKQNKTNKERKERTAWVRPNNCMGTSKQPQGYVKRTARVRLSSCVEN